MLTRFQIFFLENSCCFNKWRKPRKASTLHRKIFNESCSAAH